MKKIISIIISIALLIILIERIYISFFSNSKCKTSITKNLFFSNKFRLEKGLPLFDSIKYKVINKGKTITIKKNEKITTSSFLKEVSYYCNSNSEKDKYVINDTLDLKCRFYFTEPVITKFTLLSMNFEKQISIIEAYNLLLKEGLVKKEDKFFYGKEVGNYIE